MITDERITELWNLASNTATSKPDWTYSEIIFATVRAAIAEHDVELRKQEPVGYIKYSIGELPRFEPVIFSKCKVEGYIADWKACYSAPIPPTGETK